jgi:CDP-6-deoxy-D-xylo-4-hexulose-3-dehydrase
VNYPIAYQTWGDEEIAAATSCLTEGRTTMGDKVAQFEEAFALWHAPYPFCGSGSPDALQKAVMVNSGSSADYVMMLAAIHRRYLKPGDEVLLPAVTWPTQAWACLSNGLKVRFVDVDIHTLQMNPELIESAITPKTKALFLAHIMGNMGDMDRIAEIARAHKLYIFEDSCESLGAEYHNQKAGTFGVASAFSFFQSHHITTMEGGMVLTKDPDFEDACRMIRAHGWVRDLKHTPKPKGDGRYYFVGPGLNFRPLELEAAFGLVQIKKLDQMNAWRNRHFDELFLHTNDFSDFTRIIPGHHKTKPAWFAFPIVMKTGEDRAEAMKTMESHGIETRPLVGGNLLRHPAFAHLRECGGPFPNADRIHDSGMYLGLPPFEKDVRGILNALAMTGAQKLAV